jgi:hypothetical protein
MAKRKEYPDEALMRAVDEILMRMAAGEFTTLAECEAASARIIAWGYLACADKAKRLAK